MTNFIITTESGSDITAEQQARYGVYVIPMHITFGDTTYPDGTVSVREVYDYFDKTGKLPKTSGSTPIDFTRVFTRVFAEHPDATIIHIGYSAVTTVSFNAARIAAEDFANIFLTDSQQVSGSLTAIIIATRQFIANNPNCTAEDVMTFVAEVRERTHFHFIPKTLTYLKAGGRVSSAAVFAANLLSLHPTIKMENGYLVAGKKYRGSYERCVKKMVIDFITTIDIEPETLMICGSFDFANDDKNNVKELLAANGFHNTLWMETGTVISAHGGPGAFGIIGIEKKN